MDMLYQFNGLVQTNCQSEKLDMVLSHYLKELYHTLLYYIYPPATIPSKVRQHKGNAPRIEGRFVRCKSVLSHQRCL